MAGCSIQKKGDRYYVVVSMPNNKRKWIKGSTSFQETRQLMMEISGQLAGGQYRATKKVTFDEFVTIFLETYPKSRNLKPSTVRDYESAFRAHWSPEFGNWPLESITLEDLESFVAERLDDGTGARRVANIIVPLKTLLRTAVRWGYLRFSPATELRQPKYVVPEPDFFTHEEAHRLIDTIDPFYRPMMLCAFMTGARPGELIAFRWQDLSVEKRFIRVRHTLDRGVLLPPKSENATRRIPIPDQLISTLSAYRESWPENPAGLIFVQPETGAAIDLSNFRNRVYYPALDAAALRRTRLYTIRHTYAAWSIELGIEPYQLQRNLGHHDLGFTYRTYGHLMKLAGHEDAARLGDSFIGADDDGDAVREYPALYAIPDTNIVGRRLSA